MKYKVKIILVDGQEITYEKLSMQHLLVLIDIPAVNGININHIIISRDENNN